MTAQAIQGQTWLSEQQLWAGLDHRREQLNHFFPLQMLGEQAPLQAYPEAVSSGRAYRPEWEEQLLILKRVYQFLSKGRWIRSSKHGKINIGARRYSIGQGWGHQDFEITFDPEKIAFMMQPEQGGDPISVQPKGLSKADLMGDLNILLKLPTYQLAFPFTPSDRHRTSLAQFLAGTT
jgi:hypothetical protein